MGLLYFVALDNATATAAVVAGNDIVTLTTHATRALKVRGYTFSGLGTASAANEITINRVTTLGITPVAITPRPANNANGPAAGFTAASGWTTQPVATAGTLERFGVNANGAVKAKAYPPGLEIELAAGAAAAGQLSFRCKAGSSSIAYDVTAEEF